MVIVVSTIKKSPSKPAGKTPTPPSIKKITELTPALTKKLIAHYGSINQAAQALEGKVLGFRNRPLGYVQLSKYLSKPDRIGYIDEASDVSTILDVMKNNGYSVDDMGRIQKIKFGQSFVTTRDGTKHKNPNMSITFEPKFSALPAWPLMQPAAIKSYRHAARAAQKIEVHRVFIWPDTQIGYWNLPDGSLEPMHDPEAVEIALQLLEASGAKEVVILGDFIDATELSRWLQLKEFQNTFQPAVQYASDLIGQIRSIVGPDAKITFIMGNHERRVAEYVVTNARAAYGISAAIINACPKRFDPYSEPVKAPEHWPIFSVYKLLNLEHWNVQVTEEYPGGQYWLNEEIVFMHASPGKNDMRANVFHGHHPQTGEKPSRTVHYRNEIKIYREFTVPGLMRIDDRKNLQSLGRMATSGSGTRANWTQGVGILDIPKVGPFHYDMVHIHNGRATYDGKTWTAERPKALPTKKS